MRKTAADKIFDVAGGGLFLASIVYIIVSWNTLPDKIPAHFNGAGEVDRYGSPGELLLLPLIGTVMWAFLEFLEHHPEWHNYPARLNKDNQEQFYRLSRTLLNQVKNMCLLLFAFLSYQTIRVAMGHAENLGPWIFPILLAGTMIPIVFHLFKRSHIK